MEETLPSAKPLSEEIDSRIDTQKYKVFLERAKSFFSQITPGDRVYLNHHDDSDGITAAVFIYTYLKEKFGDTIAIDLGSEVTSTDQFAQNSNAADHIISVDYWLEEIEEGQRQLRKISSEGKSVLMIDHHDREITDLTPADLAPHESPQHDPSFPETISSNAPLTYISPKRIGSSIPSEDFPAALLTFKLISDLATEDNIDISHLQHLLRISLVGDYSVPQWEEAVPPFDTDQTAYKLGKMMNAAENLANPSILVEYLYQNPDLSILMSTPEIQVLQFLETWFHEEAERIANTMPPANGPIFHTIQPEDIRRIETNGFRLTLKQQLRLGKRLADILTSKTSPEVGPTIIIMQIVDETNEALHLHISARDERPLKPFHMGILMQKLYATGGGHPNAGSATMRLPNQQPHTEIISRTTARILELTNSPKHF